MRNIGLRPLSPKSLRSGWMAVCLLLAFAAGNAFAATDYWWDPQGTKSGGPTNGTWESSSWSTSRTGSATPIAWVEGGPAFFAVGATSSTSPFTITMNSSHTVAGMFNGIDSTPSPCNVTINGTGTITLSGEQGFYVASPGVITIDVPMAGSGASVVAEDNGELILNGTNSYSGGTVLGFTSSTTFTGTVAFNNSASFGTGPVIFYSCPVVTLAVEGNSAVNIPNEFGNEEGSTITITL